MQRDGLMGERSKICGGTDSTIVDYRKVVVDRNCRRECFNPGSRKEKIIIGEITNRLCS